MVKIHSIHIALKFLYVAVQIYKGFFCTMFSYKYTVLELMHAGCLGFKSYKTAKQLKGSSLFTYEDNELQINEKKSPAAPKKEAENKNEDAANIEEKRTYKLNKSYVKKKLFAFFNLKCTRKFCKFVTITFPCGTSDNTAHKLLNIFTTRLRKKYDFKDYLWVAERQKNDTLHFHMVINKFMPIKEINNFMRVSINNLIKKGEIERGNGDFLNYNGIDISKKIGTNLQMAKYMTKYITKNKTTSERLLNYCSISISRLFTSQVFTDTELQNLEDSALIKVNKNKIFGNDFIDFYGVKIIKQDIVFKELFEINEFIYNLQE